MYYRFLCSSRKQTWEECSINRRRNTWIVFEVEGNIFESADFVGIRSSFEDLW